MTNWKISYRIDGLTWTVHSDRIDFEFLTSSAYALVKPPVDLDLVPTSDNQEDEGIFRLFQEEKEIGTVSIERKLS